MVEVFVCGTNSVNALHTFQAYRVYSTFLQAFQLLQQALSSQNL